MANGDVPPAQRDPDDDDEVRHQTWNHKSFAYKP